MVFTPTNEGAKTTIIVGLDSTAFTLTRKERRGQARHIRVSMAHFEDNRRSSGQVYPYKTAGLLVKLVKAVLSTIWLDQWFNKNTDTFRLNGMHAK